MNLTMTPRWVQPFGTNDTAKDVIDTSINLALEQLESLMSAVSKSINEGDTHNSYVLACVAKERVQEMSDLMARTDEYTAAWKIIAPQAYPATPSPAESEPSAIQDKPDIGLQFATLREQAKGIVETVFSLEGQTAGSGDHVLGLLMAIRALGEAVEKTANEIEDSLQEAP